MSWYREELREARAMKPEQKLLLGEELFAYARGDSSNASSSAVMIRHTDFQVRNSNRIIECY